MKELGYAYAIIGWPAQDALHFYEQAVGAVLIPGIRQACTGT